MAEDIAVIGFKANTGDLDKANRKLNKLADTGEKTEKRTTKSADRMSKGYAGLASVMSKVVAIGGTLILSRGLYAAVEANRAFEQSISDLAAITGAAGEALEFYAEQSKEIGKTTTLSATQAAEAFKLIASAKPDLLDNAAALAAVTKEAVALAEAAGVDMPAAANILGGSLNQFNEQAAESGRFINVLAAGAKFGSSAIADTALALNKAGSAAASVGIGFESANAAIQVLSDSNIKGAEAGTTLRNIFLKLETSADKTLRPSLNGLAGALQNLKDQQMGTTEQLKFFGLENITAGNILLGNIEKYTKLEEAVTGTNTAYEQARIRNDNLAGDQKRLDSVIESLAITVGERLNPAMRAATKSTTGFIDAITENIDGIIQVSKWLGVMTGFYLTFITLSKTATAVSFIYATALKAITLAALPASAALTSVNAAMGVLVAAAASFYAGFKIGEYLREEFKTVRLAGAFVAEGIERSMVKLSGALRRIGAQMKNAFTNPLDLIQAKVVKFLQFFAGLGDKTLSFLGLDGLMDGVTSKLESWVPQTQKTYSDLLLTIQTETESRLAASGKVWAELQDDISSGADKAMEATAKMNKEVAKFMSEPIDTSFILDGLDEVEEKTKQVGIVGVQSSEQIGAIGQAYTAFGDVAKGVLSNIVTDTESSFDNIGQMFEDLLKGMAVDALSNQIDIALNAVAGGEQSQQQSGGGAGGLAGIGGSIGAAVPYVAMAVAVGTMINEANDEKWSIFNAEFKQANQNTGTVLGDINAKSKSLNNLTEDMLRNDSSVIGVNYLMLSALLDIRTGIVGVAEGFSATGFGFDDSGAFDDLDLGKRGYSDTAIGGALSGNNFMDELPLEDFDVFSAWGASVLNTIQDKLFDNKRTLVDSGIQFFGGTLQDIIDGGLIQGQLYADVKTEERLFGISYSTNVETTTAELSDIIVGQLTGVFASAGEALEIGASAFGINFAERLGGLVIDASTLSLKDLSVDALTAEIASFFSGTLDQWASTLLAGTDILGDFQQIGEGAFETYVRLANQTNSVMEVTSLLGMEIAAVGTSAIYTSQALIDASGGFDNFRSNVNQFISLFTSDASKLASLEGQLQVQFDALNTTLPQTAAGFYDLVTGIDITTQGGTELFSTLIALSGPMDSYITALERQSEANLAAAEAATGTASTGTDAALEDLRSSIDREIDNITATYNKQVDAVNAKFRAESAAVNSEYQTKVNSANKWLETLTRHFSQAMDTVGDSIARLTGLSSSLRSAAKANTVESQAISLARRQSAQAGLQSAISTARAGGNVGDLSDIIDRLNQDNSGLFASQFELERDSAITAHRLLELADLTDDQLSIEEQTLAKLTEQLDNAKIANERLLTSIGKSRDDQITQLLDNRDTELTALTAGFNDQVSRLEEIYSTALAQINELRGIETGVLSLTEAISSLENTMIAEVAARTAESLARIETQQVETNALLTHANIESGEWRAEQTPLLELSADSAEKTALLQEAV